MKWNLKLNGKLASLFLCSSFLPLIAQAAVSVSLSPATTSNTYSGVINLQVTGLAGGDSVVVQKYVDLNTNGIVDAPDMLWQQFKLTDGQATTFGGVTNLSVPGDLDSTSGQITAQLNLQSDFSQSIVGKYLFVVSSPVGHFTALTNVFTITNASFAQQITGNVINNGTNVPFASVLLFQPSGDGMNPKGGAVANSTGGFTIKAPAGTYTLVPFGSNFVANLSVAPNVTLNNGQTLVTNLVNTMLTATQSISGKVVDASNSSLGVPGLLVPAQGSSGLLAIATTDTNGNFNARVVGNQWKVDMDGSELNTLSYLRPQNNVRVDTTTGSVANVSIALPKATAMFYGTVKDSGGTPLPHVQLFSQDEGSFLYESDGLYSDQNGKYFAGTLAGLWSIGVSGDGNPDFANYAFTSSTNSTLSGGQALRYDFVGLLATNHITGHVQYNGNPVTGVSVFAYATIGPNTFQVQMDTDGSGNYSLNVANGNWIVMVSCQGGNDSLDNILGPGSYQCPDGQNVNINNNNQVSNFTVQSPSTTLSGRVVDNLGNPVTNMNIFAFPDGGGFTPGGITDNNGNYQIGLNGGSYTVALNTDPNTGAASRALVSPSLPVFINNGVNISGFNLVARRVTGTVTVSVTNSTSHTGVSGVYVSASCTLNGTNYNTGVQLTDATGKFVLQACNANWDVFADCGGLSGMGYSCPNNNDTIVTVANNNPKVNYLVQQCSLQFITTSLPAATLGDFYDVILDGSSCSGYLNWMYVSGSFPDWAVLDPGGEIYGTPDAPGTFNFTLSLDDGNGNYTNRALSLVVSSGGQPILGQPVWRTNRFQMLLSGLANQNYTLQTSTNLAKTNWTTLFTTNNASTGTYVVTDGKATNRAQFYRVLVGP